MVQKPINNSLTIVQNRVTIV